MASTKTPSQLATESETLATSFEYVHYNELLYAPVDFETGDDSVIPPIERKSWVPMSEADIRVKARTQFDTLFKDRAQLTNFMFMVEQAAIPVRHTQPWLLIKTSKGLQALHEDGTLHDPDGSFLPNTISWTLNEDPEDKALVMSTLTEWVGGEEELAISLLRHLATALAPHWSAGKYILLIGDGRNGKSVLMMMLQDLFGRHNCSNITRQQISVEDKSIFALNGKLLNLVFDGPAEFVKDSGLEKSIITGETIGVRKLWSNSSSAVQTNALFIEGLNQEPRSRDKSSALQARLTRFIFPNKYQEDAAFVARMRSEHMLGALLSLLIDHYILEDDKAVMLAPTQASILAQMEHMEENSLALQFIIHMEETEPLGAEAALVGMDWNDLVQAFQSWRIKNNDLTPWESPGLLNIFRPVIITERRSKRVSGKLTPVKVRMISALKQETRTLLASLKEEAHGVTDSETMVDE